MKNVALITGASSGIGLELARIHAEKGNDLVVIARSADKLEELKSELESAHSVSVYVIAADLSQPTIPQDIYNELESNGIEIEYLINNAGFGGHGQFAKRKWSEDSSMIDVNVKSLTHLTHLFLPKMLERNSGKILNVASTAGFIPGPLQAVYYATKAYVLSLSEALSEEVMSTNVNVTALCPGAVATEFAKRGHLDHLEAFQNAKSPRSVAECGYNAMMDGKRVVINQKDISFMLYWVVPFLPRSWVARISKRFMEK